MSADISQGALEGNMVSFVRYPNIKDANLNMHILQTAGIEEIVSPLMVIKPNSIWLVIERIDCTLHDYMKQLPRKWCYGKLDDTTKIYHNTIFSVIASCNHVEYSRFSQLPAKCYWIL